ncbi:MAG: hypothetical protein ABJD68_00735 [Nakamurella sp.]
MTIVVAVAGPTVVSASVHRTPTLTDLLTELWTGILTAKAEGNPFNGGDRCNKLADGSVLAPFGGEGPDFSCDVAVGTKVFVIAYSTECSTVEESPYYGKNEPSLRACARRAMSRLYAPKISVDNQPALISKVRTDLIQGTLPADNLFGLPESTPIKSTGLGWVTLIPALCAGQHVIRAQVSGKDAYGNAVPGVTTTINVSSGGH